MKKITKLLKLKGRLHNWKLRKLNMILRNQIISMRYDFLHYYTNEELLNELTLTSQFYWETSDERESYWGISEVPLEDRIIFLRKYDPDYRYSEDSLEMILSILEEKNVPLSMIEGARDAWC